jgi:hypothetical protein
VPATDTSSSATITPLPSHGQPGWRAWLNAPPHVWQPGTLNREALHAEADRLVRHPQFEEALQGFITHWLANYDWHPATHRMMRDTPLYLTLVFCMYLHYRRNVADPAGGITLSAVTDLFAKGSLARTFAGSSRVKDMLTRAQRTGWLARLPVLEVGAQRDASASAFCSTLGEKRRHDKRSKPNAPTPQMADVFRRWIWAFLTSAQPLLPLPHGLESLERINDSITYEVFSYRIASYIEDRFTITERHQPVQTFMMREHGYHVFLKLMQSAHREAGEIIASAPTATLAQGLGIARATVRNMLAHAQEQGWLQAGRGGQRVVLDPAFYQAGRHWIALELLWMHGLASAAIERRLAIDERYGAWPGSVAMP